MEAIVFPHLASGPCVASLSHSAWSKQSFITKCQLSPVADLKYAAKLRQAYGHTINKCILIGGCKQVINLPSLNDVYLQNSP